MKKKLFGLVVICLLTCSCGKVPKLENGKDAVISFSDGNKISVDDLYNDVKSKYALRSLLNLMDKYVFETTFKDYIDEAKEKVAGSIKALRANYDSDKAMEDAILEYTGLTKEGYEESLYISYLQTHATEEYARLQITDKEIEAYYKDEVKGDIDVSHILIAPKVTDDMNEEDKKKAEETAKKKAEEVISKLKDSKNIKDDFVKLAKEYSDDEATKENGGALGKINTNTLSKNYDELVKAAYELKDGSYSKKVVTTELGYHIVLRTASYDKKELSEVKNEIIETLATKLLETDKKVAYSALEHYRKEMGMKIEDTELQTQYAFYMNNLLTSIKNSEEN